MIRKIVSTFLAAVLIVFALAAVGCQKTEKTPETDNTPKTTNLKKLEKLGDYILDAGTFTELDYDFANRFFAEKYDNLGGGCTAIAKYTQDGKMLVGRNMDLNISNKAAYVVRTKVKGCYETIGLSYSYHDTAPDYLDALENGVTEDFYKTIPFMSTDVMNSEGLYVETNMRSGEVNPDGTSKFSCKGTNPAASERVYSLLLPRYIGEHCKNVAEALEYVKTLNIFTSEGAGAWNFCFLMADPSGAYGLLEVAADRVIWHDKQNAQVNFYIDEELRAIEDFQCGAGRYELVTEGVKTVETADQMYELIKKASYHQIYSPQTCPFDPVSEFVGTYPEWTIDYITAPENRDAVMTVINEIAGRVNSYDRQTMRDKNAIWESTFTEVANCTEKTLFVRFYEDDNVTMTIGFGK